MIILQYLWKVLEWLGLLRKPDLRAKLVGTNPSPDSVLPGELIVVGGPGFQKWAYLRCPCGCAEIIMLSLAKSRRPRWQVHIDRRERPTVKPSVRQIAGCYSHFWVRKGVIDWCDDTGRAYTDRVD